MTPSVFISYASEDRYRATRLFTDLQEAVGFFKTASSAERHAEAGDATEIDPEPADGAELRDMSQRMSGRREADSKAKAHAVSGGGSFVGDPDPDGWEEF